MAARESKLYQDQLYDTKVLSSLAVAILETPEFQRLGSLKQLGFTDLVYRGARHTRLEHSVGTYFMCRTMMRRIVQNHERIGLDHPARLAPSLSERLTYNPGNAGLNEDHTSAQSRWRGLTEIISAAGLLHDIGHVPFGHTLEDEFTGIYDRHDSLGSPRLYTMLFHEKSQLARVFSDDATDRWLPKLKNSELARLIYLILSWKEKIEPPQSFAAILADRLSPESRDGKAALELLQNSHDEFLEAGLFQPYMSDIVGNTICADLLDYLPRDRMNLGMDAQTHRRLQRYITIRPGSYRENEGLRVSIMVTRHGRGGQRRDVTTSILAIMRERYEMAERVYYHHKKAAASAMLVKLLELLPSGAKPRDDAAIYPSPWNDGEPLGGAPHLIHLSDSELIEYLGQLKLVDENRELQRTLHNALRYRRDLFYRTLMVIDVSLVNASGHPISYLTTELRNPEGRTPNAGRLQLEKELAEAAGARAGDVIVYCPSQSMQAKEVDVRVEIQEGRILPLRVQVNEFAYHADLDVLATYYQELWRSYIFVSPEIYRNPVKARAVVDALCSHFGLEPAQAYRKVRGHRFDVSEGELMPASLAAVAQLLDDLAFPELPKAVTARLLEEAGKDQDFLLLLRDNDSSDKARARLELLLEVVTVGRLLERESVSPRMRRDLESYTSDLRTGGKRIAIAARDGEASYTEYSADLLTHFRNKTRRGDAVDR